MIGPNWRRRIDKEEKLIDGKPIVMLPGTCSNPEPPASIRELPLGPFDLAWYMLAEVVTALTMAENSYFNQQLYLWQMLTDKSALFCGPIISDRARP
jgi:hypothetical protein